MGKKKMESSEISVHDSNIYVVVHDCENRRIVFGATSDLGYELKIEFREVVAHRFENELDGNIIFDIEDVGVEQIIESDSQLFEAKRKHGWPKIKYEGESDLIIRLKNEGVKGYQVESSYGLCGWVLAKEYRVEKIERKIEVKT